MTIGQADSKGTMKQTPQIIAKKGDPGVPFKIRSDKKSTHEMEEFTHG